MHKLTGKNIILGISGGIAAYKSAQLVRLLTKFGANVKVVMTKNATKFISPLTLQALSANPVCSELLDHNAEAAMNHIELAKWANMIIIAPASANLIARVASGFADDLLTTLILATKAKIFIAPAMNQAMWNNLATKNNIDTLQKLNIRVLGPANGVQACGDIGFGRMLEPEEIIQLLANSLGNQLLQGKKVLITAGPTRENIDPVRYISNHSSGKMGFALAQAAALAGADVTLVAGPAHLDTPPKVKRINVVTAQQMLAACLSNLPCDILLATAAVADYRPRFVNDQKIKKQHDSDQELSLELIRNPDILATLAKRDDCKFSVGFAAETQNLLQFAQIKLNAKNLDLIIANDVANQTIGFNSDDNAVTIIERNLQKTIFPKASKHTIAHQIIQFISDKLCST